MPDLDQKTILILSPQSWGKMFISKHHYAIELARRGNKIYFLNPPDQDAGSSQKKGTVTITPSGIDNLWLVNHRLWFPYRLKFHAPKLFHFLMRSQVGKVLTSIGRPVDIVWSFDIGNLYPLSLFGRTTYKIFHPVDEPLNNAAIQAAKGANVIFSVTREILEKYQAYQVPRHFINHGVSDKFFPSPVEDRALNGLDNGKNSETRFPHVGIAGNLLRPDIDRTILLEIVQSNKNVIFEFWGSYSFGESNIGGEEDDQTRRFIDSLKAQPHVILHGATPLDELARDIHRMDAFLICYDINKDQSRGTNYHKIMEFLSTGKVIISNNVTTYNDRSDLIQMTRERDNNTRLPLLFREVVARLDHFNNPLLQAERISFAKSNTYKEQINRIEELL